MELQGILRKHLYNLPQLHLFKPSCCSIFPAQFSCSCRCICVKKKMTFFVKRKGLLTGDNKTQWQGKFWIDVSVRNLILWTTPKLFLQPLIICPWRRELSGAQDPLCVATTVWKPNPVFLNNRCPNVTLWHHFVTVCLCEGAGWILESTVTPKGLLDRPSVCLSLSTT